MSNIDQGATLLLPSSFVTLIIATLKHKTTHLVPLWELAHSLLTCAFLYPIMKVEPFFKKNIWQGRWRRLFSRATLLPSLLVTHIIATPARKSTYLVPLVELAHWVWHTLEIWVIIGHTTKQSFKWNVSLNPRSTLITYLMRIEKLTSYAIMRRRQKHCFLLDYVLS